MKKILLCLIASTLALQLVSDTKASVVQEGASDWAVPFVTTAISQNLVPYHLQSDYTAPITRAEFCSLAVAVYEEKMGYEIDERVLFSDTTDENIEKAAGIGIVSEKSEGIFDPTAEITRQEAAIILSQLTHATGHTLWDEPPSFTDNDSIATWAIDSVGKVQSSGIMSGVNETEFSPLGTYTREQSITTLLRVFELQGDDTLYLLEKLVSVKELMDISTEKAIESVDLIVSISDNFASYFEIRESYFLWIVQEKLLSFQAINQEIINNLDEIINNLDEIIEYCGDDFYLESFVSIALVVKGDYEELTAFDFNLASAWERKEEIQQEYSDLLDLLTTSFKSYDNMRTEYKIVHESLNPYIEDEGNSTESQADAPSSLPEILATIITIQKEVALLQAELVDAYSQGSTAMTRYSDTKLTSYLGTLNTSIIWMESTAILMSEKLSELIEICGTHQEFSKYKSFCAGTLTHFKKVAEISSSFDAYSLQYYGSSYTDGLSSWIDLANNVTDGSTKFAETVEYCIELFDIV